MYDCLLLLVTYLCLSGRLTMATEYKKSGLNQLKLGENGFLENFAHILLTRDVYGG